MKVLVLGATGMLGHMVCRVLGASHEVRGTVRSPVASDDPLTRFLASDRVLAGVRADSFDTVRAAVEVASPDVVVNCIGIVKQLDEARDAIASITTNSLFPHLLAEMCIEQKIKLVHVSTDCVFSGRKGRYTETDTPDPVDLYGRSKLLGEIAEGEALTLRTSIVGRQLQGNTSLFEWVLSQRGQVIQGFDRAIYSGMTTMTLSKVIEQVLVSNPGLNGVWHVASSPISKFDLIERMNAELGLGLTIKRNVSYVCDRSLDGSAFVEATGIAVPSWAEMLAEFRADQSVYDFMESVV